MCQTDSVSGGMEVSANPYSYPIFFFKNGEKANASHLSPNFECQQDSFFHHIGRETAKWSTPF